ncbi:MAG: FtsK/SpoIIIE domain-containing protein [Coprococcus sp.]
MFLAQTAAEHGYDRDYSLWMEPLRNPIYIEDIERECPKSMDRELGIIATVGMCDDPAAQKQFPFNINISSIGNLAVCGTNVSGKSTFLQTLIYSLITKYSSSELNLYIADFSNKSLMCYENAPHVGGVVCDEDEDRIKR